MEINNEKKLKFKCAVMRNNKLYKDGKTTICIRKKTDQPNFQIQYPPPPPSIHIRRDRRNIYVHKISNFFPTAYAIAFDYLTDQYICERYVYFNLHPKHRKILVDYYKNRDMTVWNE